MLTLAVVDRLKQTLLLVSGTFKGVASPVVRTVDHVASRRRMISVQISLKAVKKPAKTPRLDHQLPFVSRTMKQRNENTQ